MKGSFGESMKKILSLMLILACVFSLAACSIGGTGNTPGGTTNPPAGEDVVDVFAMAAKGAVPTKIVSLSTYSGKDLKGDAFSMAGSFSQVVSGNNSILDFKYDRFATIEEMADSYIVSVEGAIAVKDGKTKTIGDSLAAKDWEAVIPSLQQIGAFNLTKEALPADYQLSADGQKLSVSLTREEALKVIGIVIDASGEISLNVEGNGKNISMVVISYTAASGASVRVASSYTYGAQTLDFSRFN